MSYRAYRTYSLTTEAGDHAFVDLSRHAHVVEVVFADQIELARLVKIKNFAAFDLGRLARLNTECPGDVVKADEPFRTEPPTMHRVENAARSVIGEIYERARLE